MSLYFTTLLATPAIDIDGTVFVQGGIFLLLFLILQPLLFRPWLEVRARRFESIEGALAEAARIRRENTDFVKQYDDGLSKAREQAAEIRSKSKLSADQQLSETVGSARQSASIELEHARKNLAEAARQARNGLELQTTELASEIAEKLLGRRL